MRPRVFPAEDHHLGLRQREDRLASMRPRVFPAEDSCTAFPSGSTSTRFNEAAGIPRGRRVEEAKHVDPAIASMRPRVFPAED